MNTLKTTLISWRAIFGEVSSQVWQRHLLLLAATFVSMIWTFYSFSVAISVTLRFFEALLYGFVLIIILLSHELGHYLHARQYGVTATLPLFIPMPFLSPFGTMGAFIRMKTLPPDKRALFDISYWGPAMSFFTSIPAIIIGLLLSEKVPVVISQPGLLVGNSGLVFGGSLLFNMLAKIFINVPDGYSILLHPVAFAGWVGLFVTAINLFPIGQLDGGHIAYVFLGKRQKYIAYLFFAILIYLSLEMSSGWTFWIFMLFLMGLRHPHVRMLDAGIHLDNRRIKQGLFSVLIFILCFIPEPLKFNARIETMPPSHPVIKHNFENFHDINFNIDSIKWK